MPDATHLQTVFQNPTATTQIYTFLGRHGKTLASGATYVHNGSPDSMARLLDDRDRASLGAALVGGKLAIVSTPAPIVEDPATGISKAVVDTAGALALADPSWGAADAIKPSITAATPANAATGIAVGTTVAVTFNEPVTGGTIVLKHGATTVTCTGPVASNSNKTYTITPGGNLGAGVLHTTTVAGYADAFGNVMVTATLTFTTAP